MFDYREEVFLEPEGKNIRRPRKLTVQTSAENGGSVPSAVQPYISIAEKGNGVINQTVFTLSALPQSVVDGTEYQSTKIYDLPQGRILVLGCTMSLAPTTTSVIADTINSGVTGALGIGTAAASNVALTSTMVDLMPSTAFTSSTTINVAAAAVGGALAASAHFDGTTTAKDVYLNSAFATTGDVDGNGTITWSGTITLTWINLGDY